MNRPPVFLQPSKSNTKGTVSCSLPFFSHLALPVFDWSFDQIFLVICSSYLWYSFEKDFILFCSLLLSYKMEKKSKFFYSKIGKSILFNPLPRPSKHSWIILRFTLIGGWSFYLCYRWCCLTVRHKMLIQVSTSCFYQSEYSSWLSFFSFLSLVYPISRYGESSGKQCLSIGDTLRSRSSHLTENEKLRFSISPKIVFKSVPINI